jgi:hypothetical protein
LAERIDAIAAWMVKDVKTCLDGDARFLAMDGIMIYLEAIKRLERASLSDDQRDAEAFKSAMEEMGYDRGFAGRVMGKVRDKMPHIYVAFGEFEIENDIAPLGSKGIVRLQTEHGKLRVYLKSLYSEFAEEVDRVARRVRGDPQKLAATNWSLDTVGATAEVISRVSGSTTTVAGLSQPA